MIQLWEVPRTESEEHCLVLGSPGEESMSFEDAGGLPLASTHIQRAAGREGHQAAAGGGAGGAPVHRGGLARRLWIPTWAMQLLLKPKKASGDGGGRVNSVESSQSV